MLGNAEERGRESPMDIDRPAPTWLSGTKKDGDDGISKENMKNTTTLPSFANPSIPATPTCVHNMSAPLVWIHKSGKGISKHNASATRRTPLRLGKNTFARKLRIDDEEDDDLLKTFGSSERPSARSKRHSSRNTSVRKYRHPGTDHLKLPLIITGYLQLLFNLLLISLLAYLCLRFFITINRDVSSRVADHLQLLRTEANTCAKQYIANRCLPETRVPALEAACLAWETCMNKDVGKSLGRAKLSAQTFAEILNGFIEPISYKTMIFFLVALFGTVFISNFAFTVARNRMSHQMQPTLQMHMPILPHHDRPQTPIYAHWRIPTGSSETPMKLGFRNTQSPIRDSRRMICGAD